MNELALFAGAGGGVLGGKLLGWRCVCGVEINAFCARRIMQRQNEGHLPPFPVWDDVRSFRGREWRGIVEVVSGGFPCQDISSAGKGAGLSGERSGLWREFKRIIREVRPRFVLVENSPVLTSRGLGVVLGDLAAMGYDACWGVLGAEDAIWAAGYPAVDHERERIWIFAVSNAEGGRQREAWECGAGRLEETGDGGAAERFHFTGAGGRDVRTGGGENGNANGTGCERAHTPQSAGWEYKTEPARAGEGLRANEDTNGERRAVCVGKPGAAGESIAATEFSKAGDDKGPESGAPADADGAGCEELRGGGPGGAAHAAAKRGGWWSAEPGMGRVAHGVAYRVDRIAAVGNGQVPAVVRLAWETLGERYFGGD